MLEDRKEINEKLHDIEDKERLAEDSSYIQNIKTEIKNTSIKRLEELRKEFVKKNVQMNSLEILAINRFVEYLKDKA
ncbi:MAG: hypothetical protein PHE29_08200 [Tissierellia bacterium]|nr:hypothetical protein [Tissierellia bacterium]MDD4779046.1 hypothetical protein [Tissierellia bacterium]